jgi:hypothetical protein
MREIVLDYQGIHHNEGRWLGLTGVIEGGKCRKTGSI